MRVVRQLSILHQPYGYGLRQQRVHLQVSQVLVSMAAAVWPWGKHRNTPIRDTPGGYIHWLCRQPDYFDGSDVKVTLLQQLIDADKVEIVNGEPVYSPNVEGVPLVANDDVNYWGY